MSSTLPIGERLRHAREARQLSLAVVAERSGLTKGFLSRVERDTTSPSVSSLVSICEAIGVPLAHIFATPRVIVMRAGDRPQAELPGRSAVDTLLTAVEERKITVIETAAGPEGSGGDALYSLPCEVEICYVVAGAIELTLNSETYQLDAGDSITFDGTVPHTWRNATTSMSRIVWILAPGLPDPLHHANVGV